MSPYPRLRPYGARDVFAPTGAQSAAFDRWAIDELDVPQPVLMENAGRGGAAVLARLFPDGPVVGFVGGGNNGGDALVLLRTLAAWGREVRAVLISQPGEGQRALLHGWPVPLVEGAEGPTGLADAGVVIDGVLGTGARGVPREHAAAVIRTINAAGRPVLAVDIPSGVDSATGVAPGEAVRADVTVAFGAPKLGALLGRGRELRGRLVVVEIGFPPVDPGAGWARVVTPEWAQARLPGRAPDTHKNAVGRVLVVAGRAGMGGAAVLTTRAAFRAGAGLVRVGSAPENRVVLQSAVPEAIYVDASDQGALADALEHADALAVGPGLGTDDAAADLLVRALAGPPVPTVLDADALNLCAAGRGPDPRQLAADRPLLLTPHPGEMGRLVDLDASTLAADRVGALRAAAERFGCAVLLKGSPSLVAGPDGALAVDAVGSSDLAVAGMGDLLTGVCASLLAQGLDAAAAGSVGLYLSGRAAVLAGRGRALTPPDVARWLPEALAERGAGHTDLSLPFVVFDQDAAR